MNARKMNTDLFITEDRIFIQHRLPNTGILNLPYKESIENVQNESSSDCNVAFDSARFFHSHSL